MSSTSAAGVSIVTLQFTLGLTLDVAEQEVQAAINAGGSLLPADLPAPPVYAKVNPADAPVLTLAISSDTLPLTEVQNLVNTRLAQKISQVTGVGLVSLSGGQRPAVRIQADTQALASYGIGLDTLRTAITSANANSAKGSFDGPTPRLHDQRERPAADGRRLPQPDRRLQERRAGAPVERRPRRGERREHAARRLGRQPRPAAPRDHPERAAPAGRQRDRDGRRDQGPAARAAGARCRRASASRCWPTARPASARRSSTSRWSCCSRS